MLTTLQNRRRHSKLAKIYAKGRKKHKQPRPSQRPPHLQSKHETRVLSIALKRYDTSAGYWPFQALYKLADLGVLSAIEYIESLLEECYTALREVREYNNANPDDPKSVLTVGPYKLYNTKTPEDKYYHGIPNNISFQKLLARLQASTPQG